MIFISILFFGSSSLYGQTRYDSLLSKVSEVDKSELPSLYMDLFVSSLNDLDLALTYAKLASENALSTGDSLNFVRAEYAIGHVLKSNGDYTTAIKHFRASLKSAQNNGFTSRAKSALNNLGLSYYSLSRFDSALRVHFESLQLREQEGSSEEISIATNNIGLVYYQLNDFSKAKLYFERTLRIEEENGLVSDYGIYVNLGLTNLNLNRSEEALKYFSRTIDNCNDNCEPKTLIEAYSGRGLCLLPRNNSKNDLEGAKADYSKALELSKIYSISTSLPSIYFGLADVYINLNELQKAQQYLDSSQNVALEMATPRAIMNNYEGLAEISALNGNFEKAYENQLLYDSVNAVVLNEVVAKNLLQIQVDFEEKENLEIIALKNKEIERATTFLFFAIIIAALTAFIVVLLYRNNASRKKVNQKLYLANETIEEQNAKLTDLNAALEERVKERTEELRKSNAALIKSNHDLDNFIYKTSHDIRGPLATLQGVCNIALMDISDPMAVDYFQKLSKTALKLNRILSKLLIINQINNSSPTNELVNVSSFVENIVEENEIGYIQKDIKVDIAVSNVRWLGDADLLKIITSNILNNAFKFHNTAENVDSFIKVDCSKEEGNLKLVISDNGIGIEDGIIDQIFDIFSKTSELQDSTGMGLYLAKLAVEKLKGSISVDSNQSGNTVFKIVIPEASPTK